VAEGGEKKRKIWGIIAAVICVMLFCPMENVCAQKKLDYLSADMPFRDVLL